MENKIKHLEMIQAIITRMNSNSFMLKGWAVTLVAGVFALASKEANEFYFLIAFIPVMTFWGLDAYYLLQERLYRDLYNYVRKLNEKDIDFSMNAKRKDFLKKKENSFSNCLKSDTIRCFYFPLTIICLLVFIISLICN